MAQLFHNPDDDQYGGVGAPREPNAPVQGPGGPLGPQGDGTLTPYSTPPYTGPTSPHFNFGALPVFRPPNFHAPTAEQALNEPGYQFRLSQGEGALENSAASKGLLRTGGSLKDFINYGQNFASNEYQRVFDRALNVYDRVYQGAKDSFAPKLLEYSTLAGAEQARALAAFNQAEDLYKFGIDDEFRNRALAGGINPF